MVQSSTILLVITIVGILAIMTRAEEIPATPVTQQNPGETGGQHYGELVKLALLQGVKPSDAKELYASFEMVLGALKGIADEEKQTYAQSAANYRTFVQGVESSYRSIKDQLSDAQSQLTLTLYPLRKSLESQIASLRKQIYANKDEIKTLEETFLKNRKILVTRLRSLTDLIAAVDRAIQVLNDWQAIQKKGNSASGGSTSTSTGSGASGSTSSTSGPPPDSGTFIQMADARAVVDTMRRHLDQVGMPSILPQMTMLLSKLEGDFDAKQSTQKIISLLNKLRRRLDRQRVSTESDLSDLQTAFNTSSKNLWDLDASLRLNQAKLQDDLDRTSGQIQVAERQVKSLTDVATKWKAAVTEAKEIFQKNEDSHKKQAGNYAYEIKLVKKAMDDLQANGVSPP